MSFEVTCGQCSGRLTVEQAGVVVACPHCGAHLNVADPNAPTEAPAPQPAVEAPAPAVVEGPVPAETPAPAQTSVPSFDLNPVANETAPDFSSGFPGFDPNAPIPGQAFSPESAAVETTPDPAAVTDTAPPDLEPAMVEVPETGTSSASPPAPPPTESATAPAEFAVAETGFSQTSASPASRGSVSKRTFLLVASYASAMTIAAVWLLMRVLNPTANNLESLPDLEPKRDRSGQIGLNLVPEDAPMPLGHELKLGDEQRFGNLKVTVLRVTRGPVEFTHYDPASTATKDPVSGVLKLWLRFENLSEDQSIAPLRSLVFKRDSTDIDRERANNFVCRVSEKKKDGQRLLVYDHVLSGEWDIRDMKVDEEIPPGGSLETFIPTTPDGVDALFGADEPLVWRVHFRKGYSPKNFGVTTLFEVTFAEEEVTFDSPPGTQPEADGGEQTENA